MTTYIHLVRHGHHPLLGRVLCGRMPGVELDERGCLEMQAVAEALIPTAPRTIQSSPQRRTLQSAAIIASRCGVPVEIVPVFDEIDMGSWTGATFAELEDDTRWRRWNEKRDSARPPKGESMSELQSRVVRHIEQLANFDGSIIIVSHAEPIRAALMYYLGIAIDRFHSVDVDPASISTIRLTGKQAIVSRINLGAAV